jgi:hypothetical protein
MLQAGEDTTLPLTIYILLFVIADVLSQRQEVRA